MSATATPTPTPTLRQDRVWLVALLHAKEGLSFDAFDSYWTHEHAQVFASIDIVKRNLTKYEQFHFNPALNQAIQAQGSAALPYAGMAVFEAETYEKIMAVFTDPEYLRVVVPDEEKFLDRAKCAIVGGPFATFWEQ